MNDDVFTKVGRELAFLEDVFDYREVERWDGRVLGVSVLYENATTAVQVIYERREPYLQIDLWHIVGGKGPRNARSNASYVEANRLPLHELIAVRCPSLSMPVPVRRAGDSWFDDAISRYAMALREHATDVLRGDFSVLETIRQNQEHSS